MDGEEEKKEGDADDTKDVDKKEGDDPVVPDTKNILKSQ